MSTPIPFGWRQTRIFTKDFTGGWYLDFLCSVVIPFQQKFPSTPFFITRYESVRGAGDEDKADTKIEDLPADYVNPANQRHRSLRLRYAVLADEDAFLDQQINRAKYWLFDFRGYDLLDGLGGGRFCTSTALADRRRRAEIFAQVLWHHSRLFLDTVVQPAGVPEFEENKDANNTDHETIFATELHLLKNSAAAKQTDTLPLLLLSRANPGGLAYPL